MTDLPLFYGAGEGARSAAASRRRHEYQRALTLVLQLSDLILLNIAFVAAYYLRYYMFLGGDVADENFVSIDAYLPLQIGLTFTLMLIYHIAGLYRSPLKGPVLQELWNVLLATSFGITLLFAGVYLIRGFAYSRGLFLIALALTAALLMVSRIVARIVQAQLRRRGIGVERTLVIGGAPLGLTVMHVLATEPGLGHQLVGFVHENVVDDLGRFKCLGLMSNLGEVVQQVRIDSVILALPSSSLSRDILTDVREICDREAITLRVVPDLFELSLSRSAVDVEDFRGLPVMSLHEPSISGFNLAIKRGMDVLVSSGVLVALSPIWAVFALAIKLDSSGPVCFTQERVGKGGKTFKAFKFRSMITDAEQVLSELQAHNEASGPIFKMRADPRVTRVGKWLRRTSLDEIPQLWNVLRGEMSLVGPRPPLPSEVAKYEEWHLRRLGAAPGMTGMWQVNGRSELPFDEMVLLDLYYIENWSLGLDLHILLRTIPAVLSGRGAY